MTRREASEEGAVDGSGDVTFDRRIRRWHLARGERDAVTTGATVSAKVGVG